MEIQDGARKLIGTCGGVRPSETVLVLLDLDKMRIASATAAAILERQAVPVILLTDALRDHGGEPPRSIAAAMEEADVILAMTEGSMSQTQASVAALAKGARMISFPGANEAMLTSGLIEADLERLKPAIRAVALALDAGHSLRVTAPGGTDLAMEIRGRRGRALDGFCHEPGTSMSMSLEANVGPLEKSANGVLVVDGSLPEAGKLDAPIRIVLKEGRIADIRGGQSAARLRRFLEARGDAELLQVGEFGVGLNPRATITGTSYLEDESAYGTAHIGFGTNIKQGGTVRATGHYDAIFRSPTIEVDGEKIIDAGELLLARVV